MIEIRGTGHIYRNPKPHLRARHAWHPTLVVIDQNELIAAFDIGEAVESLDYRTYINRSHDGGQTWDAPVPMFPDNLIQHPTRRTTHIGDRNSCRMANWSHSLLAFTAMTLNRASGIRTRQAWLRWI